MLGEQFRGHQRRTGGHEHGPLDTDGPGGYSQSGTGDLAIYYLTPGDYTLTWGDVSGWAKPSPPSSTQTLAFGGTITFTGTYSAVPLIQVTPPILNFGYVAPGSSKDLTLEVKNIGTATLTGAVSTSPPFSIISGEITPWGRTEPRRLSYVTRRHYRKDRSRGVQSFSPEAAGSRSKR